MARDTKVFQVAFTAGELGERIEGRADTAMYRMGCRRLENVIVTPQGTARRRPGMRHLWQYSAVSTYTRMIPFVFDENEHFLLVIDHLKISIYDLQSMTKKDEIVSPWPGSVLGDLTVARIADTLVVCHPVFQPRRLIRKPSGWSIELFFYGSQSVRPLARMVEGAELKPSAVGSAPMSFTASRPAFRSDMAGETIRFRGREYRVTGYVSATKINAQQFEFEKDLLDTKGSLDWQEEAFSANKGYPGAVAVCGGRLWFGGSTSLPHHLFASQVNDFTNFAIGDGLANEALVLDTGATGATSSSGFARIQHMVSGRGGLEVFTSTSEGLIPFNDNGGFTPETTRQMQLFSSFGCSKLRPTALDGSTLFVQAGGSTLREYQMAGDNGSYVASSLITRAPDVINDVVDFDVIVDAFGLKSDFVFVVNGDGTASILSTLRAESVAAWSTMRMFGTSKVRRVCAVGRRLFFLVSRAAGWAIEEADIEAKMDGQGTKNGPMRTTSSGWDHLAGMAGIDLLVDQHYEGRITISQDGRISAPFAGLKFTAGTPIVPIVHPMPASIEGLPLIGRRYRVPRIDIKLIKSGAVLIDGQPIQPPSSGSIFSGRRPDTTEDVTERRLGWKEDGVPVISQIGPFGFEIGGLVFEISLPRG